MSSLCKVNKCNNVYDTHALVSQSVCAFSDYHAWDNDTSLAYQLFGGYPNVAKPTSSSTTGFGIFLTDDHSDNYVSFDGIGSPH